MRQRPAGGGCGSGRGLTASCSVCRQARSSWVRAGGQQGRGGRGGRPGALAAVVASSLGERASSRGSMRYESVRYWLLLPCYNAQEVWPVAQRRQLILLALQATEAASVHVGCSLFDVKQRAAAPRPAAAR